MRYYRERSCRYYAKCELKSSDLGIKCLDSRASPPINSISWCVIDLHKDKIIVSGVSQRKAKFVALVLNLRNKCLTLETKRRRK